MSRSKSTRMGIAFSIVAISLLLGTPIEGAILHTRSAHDGFQWLGSIIFCGVGLFPVFFRVRPWLSELMTGHGSMWCHRDDGISIHFHCAR